MRAGFLVLLCASSCASTRTVDARAELQATAQAFEDVRQVVERGEVELVEVVEEFAPPELSAPGAELDAGTVVGGRRQPATPVRRTVRRVRAAPSTTTAEATRQISQDVRAATRTTERADLRPAASCAVLGPFVVVGVLALLAAAATVGRRLV